MFEYQGTVVDGSRYGRFYCRAGWINTPAFMPVATRGSIKGLALDLLRHSRPAVILANGYHLSLRPGADVIAQVGGLHQFMAWPGPILTDSGGFQVFSLANSRRVTEEGVDFTDFVTGNTHRLTPETSIQTQLDLGADIIMAFDDVLDLKSAPGRSRVKASMDRTHRWLARSWHYFQHQTTHLPKRQRPLFFAIAQGGLEIDLRLASLEYVQALPVDGIAIGGLSVGETKSEMYRILQALQPAYDDNRPRYLMGVGDPPDLRFAFEHGIDMTDCVLPTRNARHGTVWLTGDRTVHLTNQTFQADRRPIEPGCQCLSCHFGYSRAFLRHQFKTKDPVAGSLASIHNLFYLNRIAAGYRP